MVEAALAIIELLALLGSFVSMAYRTGRRGLGYPVPEPPTTHFRRAFDVVAGVIAVGVVSAVVVLLVIWLTGGP